MCLGSGEVRCSDDKDCDQSPCGPNTDRGACDLISFCWKGICIYVERTGYIDWYCCAFI